MSENRIKELQDFADDFKQKLKVAKEKYENSLSKSMEDEEYLDNDQSKNYKTNISPKIIKNKNINVNNIYNYHK